MKIAVLGCFYGCADLLPKALEPWIILKNQGYPLVLGAINAQFKEYAELGFPNDDDATRSVLEKNRAHFDVLHIASEPLTEKDVRNTLLKGLLSHGADAVWLLDGDEMYTVEQIKDIIEYVEKTPQFDYYHIPFKNYMLNGMQWDDNFTPPRIFRTDRHGGIKEFFWDNDIGFTDGTEARDTTPGMIPRRVAYVVHRTWDRADGMEKKILYQKRRFGSCPFSYNASTREASFDADYFAQAAQKVPTAESGGKILYSDRQGFDIILRTHTTGNFREHITRVTDTLGDKPELTIRSLRSLIYSLLVLERANLVRIRLTIVDDHSDEQSVSRMNDLLDICPFETKLIHPGARGNPASLQTSLEYARERKGDFIFFAEDDYLHVPTAMVEMIESYRLFSRKLNRPEVGLFPVDYSDFYLPNAISPTRVVLGSRRHWRVSYSTTDTFFIHRSTLDTQWELLIRNPAQGKWEEDAINEIWRNHAILFSPIPTLSYHMHGEEQMPPFSDWKKLWDSLGEPTL